jgi:hypothetical protein
LNILFDDAATYGRWGLAWSQLGMGAHLAPRGRSNQAALARDHAHAAAAAWIASASCSSLDAGAVVATSCLRAEVGYLGAATLLSRC